MAISRLLFHSRWSGRWYQHCPDSCSKAWLDDLLRKSLWNRLFISRNGSKNSLPINLVPRLFLALPPVRSALKISFYLHPLPPKQFLLAPRFWVPRDQPQPWHNRYSTRSPTPCRRLWCCCPRIFGRRHLPSKRAWKVFTLSYTEGVDVVFTKKNSSLLTLERGRWIGMLCDSSNLHKQKLVKPNPLASKKWKKWDKKMAESDFWLSIYILWPRSFPSGQWGAQKRGWVRGCLPIGHFHVSSSKF